MNAKLIINPSSGHRTVQNSIAKLAEKLKSESIIDRYDIYYTNGKNDAFREALNLKERETDFIIAVGGDGTVNEVVNGIVKGGHKTPLAIFPAGTANDFAYHIGMSQDINRFCDVIRNGRIIKSDAGISGGEYFMNVASGGLLTDVAHSVSPAAKSILGHMAYLIEGAKELTLFPELKSVKLKISANEKTIEDDILLFIVSNSPRVGGFRSVSPKADISDGLLDVLVIHKQNFMDMINLFIQLNNGTHIENRRISYFQTNKLKIECKDSNCIILDIDGEKGDRLPVEIGIIPGAVNLFVSEKYFDGKR